VEILSTASAAGAQLRDGRSVNGRGVAIGEGHSAPWWRVRHRHLSRPKISLGGGCGIDTCHALKFQILECD
jgi:hypothetical protein